MGGHNSLQHGYTIVYNRGAHCAPPWGLSLFSDAGAGRVNIQVVQGADQLRALKEVALGLSEETTGGAPEIIT